MSVFGKQIFLYILKHFPQIIKTVYLSKELDKKLFHQVRQLNVPIIKLDSKKAQAKAKCGNHQGFFLDIEPIQTSKLDSKANSLLVLYKVTDVGNIGAIVRSAYAFGIDQVVITGLKSINIEAIIRTSSGALIDTPICIYEDTFALVNELHQNDFGLYGLDVSGQEIKHINLKKKKAIIVGNEAEGIPPKFLKKCNNIISIPMKRNFDSLNVSVATGIILERILND